MKEITGLTDSLIKNKMHFWLKKQVVKYQKVEEGDGEDQPEEEQSGFAINTDFVLQEPKLVNTDENNEWISSSNENT